MGKNTAAEIKAKSLVDKFMPMMNVRKEERQGTTLSVSIGLQVMKDNAKQCALICVEEIINHIQRRVDDLHDNTDVSDLKDWKKIKTAITNQ